MSIAYFNFKIQYSANLIQGGLQSPQDEEFNLEDIPPGLDDSPERGDGHSTHQGHSSDPESPTRAKKAGTRLASSGDDTFQFYQLINGKRQCTFCM